MKINVFKCLNYKYTTPTAFFSKNQNFYCFSVFPPVPWCSRQILVLFLPVPRHSHLFLGVLAKFSFCVLPVPWCSHLFIGVLAEYLFCSYLFLGVPPLFPCVHVMQGTDWEHPRTPRNRQGILGDTREQKGTPRNTFLSLLALIWCVRKSCPRRDSNSGHIDWEIY